ncbi:hypothetical protein C8E89_12224 [Mycolicibacterium moriokaense]|uniref:Uncharacterized protein n=1 Tax=Mycolicibacterium moriokaense TaxID=39691 RepID=A0A318H9Q4_9MYCO|nr:hypothetical protein C8E89_12224 [Mycolicibacterium moriokaense]
MIAPPGWRFDRTDEAALISKDPRAPLAPQQTYREVFDEGSRYYPAICVARISTRCDGTRPVKDGLVTIAVNSLFVLARSNAKAM